MVCKLMYLMELATSCVKLQRSECHVSIYTVSFYVPAWLQSAMFKTGSAGTNDCAFKHTDLPVSL